MQDTEIGTFDPGPDGFGLNGEALGSTQAALDAARSLSEQAALQSDDMGIDAHMADVHIFAPALRVVQSALRKMNSNNASHTSFPAHISRYG
jgi:hypothetical protein